jgi:multicomponent Na+:H+ antiporter subunit D
MIPAMSLAGVPPLSGFFAKLILIIAGLQTHSWIIVSVALIVSLLTLFSMTKIWANAFWKAAPAVLPDRHGMSAVRWRGFLMPMMVLAGITVAIGFLAGLVFDVSAVAAEQLMNPDAYIEAVLGGAGS